MAKISAEQWAEAQAAFDDIAMEYLDVPTLKPRNMDSLDFHELSVGSIQAALEAAFATGFQAARRKRKPKPTT